MLIVETIAKIRRAYFVQDKSIKAIRRELGGSRKVVRKVLRIRRRRSLDDFWAPARSCHRIILRRHWARSSASPSHASPGPSSIALRLGPRPATGNSVRRCAKSLARSRSGMRSEAQPARTRTRSSSWLFRAPAGREGKLLDPKGCLQNKARASKQSQGRTQRRCSDQAGSEEARGAPARGGRRRSATRPQASHGVDGTGSRSVSAGN